MHINIVPILGEHLGEMLKVEGYDVHGSKERAIVINIALVGCS